MSDITAFFLIMGSAYAVSALIIVLVRFFIAEGIFNEDEDPPE